MMRILDHLRRRLVKMSDVYPPRWWWPIVRIYGGPEGQRSTVYMTRVIWCPQTRFGAGYLHVFHREDVDRDPHDHPFDYWTLPINQGYWEHVYSPKNCFRMVRVPAWRWSHRPAEHRHRVVRTETGRWPLVTIVWRGPGRRKWGFWVRRFQGSPDRFWVYYRNYVYGSDGLYLGNLGGPDVNCPGEPAHKEIDR